MKRVRPTVLIAIVVALSAAILLYGAAPGWLIVLAGLLFVAGGTLLGTLISEGMEQTRSVLTSIPALFRHSLAPLAIDPTPFLEVSEAHRRGLLRTAERALERLPDPLLREGARCIVDGGSRESLERRLQWHMARQREQERRRIRVLQGMAGFAPALGMLGTLLGLTRMLFSLGETGLETVGTAMGFAMITTVYGLVAANLLIKPVITKMEQEARQRLAAGQVRAEMLLMMDAREHATAIRDALTQLLDRATEVQSATAPAVGSRIRLVGA